MWVDPGQYIVIYWNSGHAKTTPVHPFTVEEVGAHDNQVPKEDLVLKLFDYRLSSMAVCTRARKLSKSKPPGPSMYEVDIYRLYEGEPSPI